MGAAPVIDSYVFHMPDGYWFEVRRDGEEIDEAGPFDDEYDAEMAARRAEEMFA